MRGDKGEGASSMAARLVLASASPRRAELLRQLGVPFQVMPSDVPEVWPRAPAREGVLALALAKARSVARGLAGVIVLGADTAVVLEGRAFGKPESAEEARRMLLE
ncbi:MAG: Maf family protein, partial [Burkholderiales bacterium]